MTGPALNDVPDPYSMIGGSTQAHAFLWDKGVMQDLGTLGGPDSFPIFVNNRGQVAGMSYASNVPDPNSGVPPLDPFLWTKGKSMQDLGNFGGTNPFGFFSGSVNGLNNRGQVVGVMTLPGDMTARAFLWDGGKLSDLGTLGGHYSQAIGLNEAGVVVGEAYLSGVPTENQTFHAFRWENGVMQDIGTVDGDLSSEADYINSEGQIVGVSCAHFNNCDVTRAFLWENGGPSVDLNALISPNSPLQLVWANLITDRGEIVGFSNPPGCANPDVCNHAFVLIPCDENHPGVEGCDYSLVEVAATAQPRLAQVTHASAPANVAKLSPAEMMTRFHSTMSSRNRWLRSLLSTLAHN